LSGGTSTFAQKDGVVALQNGDNMAFDLKTWQDKFKEKLIGLDLRAQTAQRKSLYGVIAGCAFLPLIAAIQGGDHNAAMLAGQMLSGSVGVNLLSTLLQKKQDAVDAEWGVVDPAALAAQAEANPELRKDLDAMLSKLDAIALIKQQLSEAQIPQPDIADRLPAQRVVQHLGFELCLAAT
jgi:hypothetical protein